MILMIVSCLILHPDVEAPTDAACVCAEARSSNGWCKACNVGYVASVKIESELLFEALDAHGHKIDPDLIQCKTCKQALATDGFCDPCRMGFVNKQAYLSRLTYHLAKGSARDVAKIACPTCRMNAGKHGWCDSCRLGMVAGVEIKDKEDFEYASKAYELLLSAVRTASRCELCAAAMITGGQCPKCTK